MRADFLCLHSSPNAVGDNTWAYFIFGFHTGISLENLLGSDFLFCQVSQAWQMRLKGFLQEIPTAQNLEHKEFRKVSLH